MVLLTNLFDKCKSAINALSLSIFLSRGIKGNRKYIHVYQTLRWDTGDEKNPIFLWEWAFVHTSPLVKQFFLGKLVLHFLFAIFKKTRYLTCSDVWTKAPSHKQFGFFRLMIMQVFTVLKNNILMRSLLTNMSSKSN